ncbi:Splicing factor U2af small subunit A [Linum perenne]
MEEHLASIFGTEKDRVNCPFYFKIGTYSIGDRCFRLHTPSLALVRLYSSRTCTSVQTCSLQASIKLVSRKIQDNYEDFYQELFEELSKHGHIESLDICDNLADHMVENVYVEFRGEDHVATALQSLTGQFYAEISSYLIAGKIGVMTTKLPLGG